jgi:hypothetical protein
MVLGALGNSLVIALGAFSKSVQPTGIQIQLENFCGMISKLFHKSNSKRKILNFP